MLWRNNVNLLCNQMFYFYFNSTTNNTFVNKSYSDTSLLVACFLTNDHFCSLHSSPSKQHTVNKSYWNTVFISVTKVLFILGFTKHIYIVGSTLDEGRMLLSDLHLNSKGKSIISKLVYFTKKSCLLQHLDLDLRARWHF